MQPIWNTFLDLVFPPRCAGCGTRGAWFCACCVDRCEALSPLQNKAEHARVGLAALASSTGVFTFGGPLRDAIHALKYRRQWVLAEPLGMLLMQHHAPTWPAVDAIVPVPLHAARQRERGFNQAEKLAAVVARERQLPLLVDRLRRIRATRHQTDLDHDQRQANVGGAFRWAGGAAPRRVLLCDDVLTSGATMASCAVALKAAGTETVHALALARGGL